MSQKPSSSTSAGGNISKIFSNLFRGFDKKNGREDQLNKQERSFILDNFINHKKPANKNSIKIQKFLTNILSRGTEEAKPDIFLDFISTKHKIPLEIVKKAIKLQIGYVHIDFNSEIIRYP